MRIEHPLSAARSKLRAPENGILRALEDHRWLECEVAAACSSLGAIEIRESAARLEARLAQRLNSVP
jgi:hypothetical protein